MTLFIFDILKISGHYVSHINFTKQRWVNFPNLASKHYLLVYSFTFSAFKQLVNFQKYTF